MDKPSGPPAAGFVPVYPNVQPPPYNSAMPPMGAPSGQPVYIVQTSSFGPEPARMTCPYCHADIETRLETDASAKTHLFALLLCLICFPCVCVPYCMDSCLLKKHYCPSCNSFLGQYES